MMYPSPSGAGQGQTGDNARVSSLGREYHKPQQKQETVSLLKDTGTRLEVLNFAISPQLLLPRTHPGHHQPPAAIPISPLRWAHTWISFQASHRGHTHLLAAFASQSICVQTLHRLQVLGGGGKWRVSTGFWAAALDSILISREWKEQNSLRSLADRLTPWHYITAIFMAPCSRILPVSFLTRLPICPLTEP